MGLHDLIPSVFSQGRDILGDQRRLSIDGGPLVEVIENEARRSRDYGETLHDVENSIEVLATRTAFAAAYPGAWSGYQGCPATLGSDEWRIGDVEIDGRGYILIRLVGREEGA